MWINIYQICTHQIKEQGDQVEFEVDGVADVGVGLVTDLLPFVPFRPNLLKDADDEDVQSLDDQQPELAQHKDHTVEAQIEI